MLRLKYHINMHNIICFYNLGGYFKTLNFSATPKQNCKIYNIRKISWPIDESNIILIFFKKLKALFGEWFSR